MSTWGPGLADLAADRGRAELNSIHRHLGDLGAITALERELRDLRLEDGESLPRGFLGVLRFALDGLVQRETIRPERVDVLAELLLAIANVVADLRGRFDDRYRLEGRERRLPFARGLVSDALAEGLAGFRNRHLLSLRLPDRNERSSQRKDQRGSKEAPAKPGERADKHGGIVPQARRHPREIAELVPRHYLARAASHRARASAFGTSVASSMCSSFV